MPRPLSVPKRSSVGRKTIASSRAIKKPLDVLKESAATEEKASKPHKRRAKPGSRAKQRMFNLLKTDLCATPKSNVRRAIKIVRKKDTRYTMRSIVVLRDVTENAMTAISTEALEVARLMNPGTVRVKPWHVLYAFRKWAEKTPGDFSIRFSRLVGQIVPASVARAIREGQLPVNAEDNSVELSDEHMPIATTWHSLENRIGRRVDIGGLLPRRRRASSKSKPRAPTVSKKANPVVEKLATNVAKESTSAATTAAAAEQDDSDSDATAEKAETGLFGRIADKMAQRNAQTERESSDSESSDEE